MSSSSRSMPLNVAADAGRIRIIDEPAEVSKLMARMAASESNALLQVEGQDRRCYVKVSERTSPGKKRLFVQPETGANLKELIQGLEAAAKGAESEDHDGDHSPALLLLVYLTGQAVIGIKTSVIGFPDLDDLPEEGNCELHLDYPEKLFRIQRREQARFWILGGYEIFVSINSVEGNQRRVNKRLLDISASGLSFHVLSHREAGLYKPGMLLRNIRLRLNNRDLLLDGEVRNCLPMPQGSRLKGSRIGVKFLRIREPDAEWIKTFVLYHMAHTLV